MKVLYVVPKINAEGGLERILSLKANYLATHYQYDVSILTQNRGNKNLFYPLDESIHLHDIDLSGNRVQFIFKYLRGIKKIISYVNPDVLIVADSMYKTFLLRLVVRNKKMIYECHNSIHVQLSPQKKSFFSKWYSKLLLLFNRYMASKMDVFVALSSESIKEWNIKNHGVIIPNPNWLKTDQKANLNAKKILIVARHSYEKGLDRFLDIWKKLAPKYPDWCVEIIGKDVEKSDLQKMASVMGISNSITFFTPTHKIETKYLDASIYVMTSRFEAFPMVLIEAMACGLPTIAYDCPCGPRAIIQDNINGLLIDNGDEKKFSTALESLMNSYQLREMLGENAKKSILKYEVGHIMKTWDELLKAF